MIIATRGMEPVFGSKLALFMPSSHDLRTDEIPFVAGAAWPRCAGTQSEKRAQMGPCLAWSAREGVGSSGVLPPLPQKDHPKSPRRADALASALPFHQIPSARRLAIAFSWS